MIRLASTFILLLLVVPSAWAADTLHVFHTNDSLGRLQRNFTADEHEGVGGMDRIVGLLTDLQQQHAVSLVVDGGDVLGSAALSNFDGGRLMVELLTAAGVAAIVVGNHEFDYGLDTLRQRAEDAGFPFLGANVQVPGTSPLRPYVIVERGGRRLGLIGVIDPTLAGVINKQRNPGLVLGDPAAALEQWLPALADSTD
ncbi:MAG: metallophosphoesterase, partial [bacterium]|nr:metallophosphoesterase [bacterium]